MIGVGGIRESHSLNELFSKDQRNAPDWAPVPDTQPPVWMNIKALDDIFNRGSAQSKQYGLTWWFQGHDRLDYATPPNFEAMAFALVSRYKDRNTVWEVENEPNFNWSPEDYVNKALIPFAKGAKRADPNCKIMGPDCVCVRENHSLPAWMRMFRTRREGLSRLIVSTHTYPGPGESSRATYGNLATLKALRMRMAAPAATAQAAVADRAGLQMGW